MGPEERKFLIEFSDVRRAREEVEIQLALGKAEAEEAFEALETKFQEAARKASSLQQTARADGTQIATAGALLIAELKHGYQHIRTML